MDTFRVRRIGRFSCRSFGLSFICFLTLWSSRVFGQVAGDASKIGDQALQQILALDREKDARRPAQKKMDSQLIYAAQKLATGVASAAAPAMQVDARITTDGQVLVDITATVNDDLLGLIRQVGGQIVSSVPRYDAIRALVPVAQIETLAGRDDVRFVARAYEGAPNAGSVDGEGDTCHRAISARSMFGVDGTGVKVGALSDSVDFLANSQALGDLGPVFVVPGQAGSGEGEGTAMLEIIHDLAPGATLYFATANSGPAGFAANINALVASNCNIIVDDFTYFYESPFQDGQPIAQAVKSASDAGVLYFSSARNSGNKDDGTSGTWEGDFTDGGPAGSPLPAGRVHNFGGGTNYNTVTAVNQPRADLFWADPLGGSSNDYDLYVLDSTGATVLRSSTTTQNGSQDPYESVSTLNVGERIVILQKTGAAGRFLHLDTGRSQIAINTAGNVRGHNVAIASNAFGVAAVDVHDTSPFPSPFTVGSKNPVQTFSSDGPRQIFFNPNGSAITPGNFSSTGGVVFLKPDITAADGASTSAAVPGFSPFYGTSAAAPHAAAIAALLKCYNQFLTPAQIRAALTNTALDIMGSGWDRDSGSGIVMALEALEHVSPADPSLKISPTSGLSSTGSLGGTFSPSCVTYTLTNQGTASFNWSATKTQPWLTLTPSNGTLAVGQFANVSACINTTANSLSFGPYSDTIAFSNFIAGVAQFRSVTLTVQVQTVTLFLADFESGNEGFTYTADPVATSNLWHLTTRRSASPTHSQYYGLEATGTYDTGARNAGNLVSPPISLVGAISPVTLSFKYFLQTENFAGFDVATVQVSTNAGSTWITLGTLPDAPGFTTSSSDISALTGTTVLVQFNFDTVDNINNDFEGWYVDDVTITARLGSNTNQPPVVTAASISPASPTTTNVLSVTGISTNDPDGDPITLAYQWQQSTNNVTFTNIAFVANTLPAAATIAGDYYRVAITPNDGHTNGATFITASVLVPVDADGNGINDDWEVQYFGHIGINPNADADGTGQNNLFKYVTGLDPTNPASVFSFQIAAITNQPARDNLLFNPLASGRTYTPQFTTNLTNSAWMPLTGYLGPVTNGNQITITDTNATPPQKFYRLDISLP
jgi:hypothetical protein